MLLSDLCLHLLARVSCLFLMAFGLLRTAPYPPSPRTFL